jgi:glyoxylase-like metal-dependent hydrolase (beta-lactamase superfamily II)
VVTHPNPDKFNGASAFQAIGAKVVASKATAAAIPGVHAYKKSYFVEVARMFTAETYPRQATLDVTFEGSFTLPLEAGSVRLVELKHAGVSTTQTVAVVAEARSLFVGDLVHHQAHAWLEGGIRDGKPQPDLASWRAALDELTTFAGYTVHGGRGQVTPVEQAVPAQQAYLSALESLVKEYVQALPDRAVLQGASAGEHWKALAGKAQQRFPEHAFPYLIEYGVYGLALSM